MSQQLSWARDGETLTLTGELDQDLLNPLWDARHNAMQGVTLIDLHGVTRVDTAGIALLAHLVATGKKQGSSVTLTGVSDNVVTLAQLYNLPEDVLPRYKMLSLFSLSDDVDPMENNEIQTVLMNALSLQEAHVSGDGSHFQVIAVGEMFDGMSRVKKQQAVYAPLMEYIADNRIHALSIKAFTPQEWARDRKLNGF